ncbi:hypothetical protein K461DRAFT_226472 [Myriangium duriaei CBS 260.36]|uniref:Sister chromatid cohesion protein Dcc1 n=1 Tax=Myriangium duriaei CBS 260.36 TaxID=1168546 RepID=A0A9P4MGT1_9PEZI|nr:hypothetical protein K461DRAFT_226472 [Myriangium duriaei CBS 260.36]
MSSQAGPEISFAISSEQKQFRLMELPAELVTLLNSPQPPTLHFKSSPSGNAALCLPDKTFHLRQVHTSNSVHIIQPEAEERGTSGTIEQPGLVAMAQCGSTLELIGTSPESASSYLKAALPVYAWPAEETSPNYSKLTKRQVFDDVPLSDAEIAQAWEGLCAFESDEGQSCFQPSPRALVHAWATISTTATLEKIKLDQPLSAASMQLILASAEDVPQSLLEAIIQSLLVTVDDKTQLDKGRTVKFVGGILIQDLVETRESDFLRQWQNLLPEPWRTGASIGLISDLCEKSTSTGSVRLLATISDSSSSAPKKAPSNAKRKWHEKFKQVRDK